MRQSAAAAAAGYPPMFSHHSTRTILAAVENWTCMKNYAKILFSILTAMICLTAFAADEAACKKSGKNCPMNNGKACNCGKSCSC